MKTQNLILKPCSVLHLELLIADPLTFSAAFGWGIADGYLEFPGALEYSLKQVRETGSSEWGSHLFIHEADAMLIGLGGYKGAPNSDGVVEIGYGIAPAYRGRGYAREAAQGLIDHALALDSVQKVIAHTLGEENASVSVLRRCGMVKVAEINDPDNGTIWRWEIVKLKG